MKHLNKENINKNQVETVEQFKVLSYLKSTFNFDEIELYLYDKTTIKLIDKNKVQAYFKYNKQSKKVEFYEKMHSKNELERRDRKKILSQQALNLDIRQIQIWELRPQSPK